jgi:5'-nucleotidase
MRILIANDDGVLAPGLHALAHAMSKVGDIEVIAPDRNRSGASNSLTLENPLRVETMANGFMSVEGTPTDCIHLALTGLIDYEPDLVVSGINHGANMGDDVLYSGTVAAAMEGYTMGLPALAFSLAGDKHFATAATIARQMVQHLQADVLPLRALFNINVPDLPLDQLRGIQITRLGNRHRAEKLQRQTDPRGREIFWIGKAGAEQDAGEGTDFYAIQQGFVSVTPLQLDLTHYAGFDLLANWLTGLTIG